jgi:hypothetical protein
MIKFKTFYYKKIVILGQTLEGLSILRQLNSCTPYRGFGTAEVGITLALVAILMISFLVLGSHLKFAIEQAAPPQAETPTEETITLRIPQ